VSASHGPTDDLPTWLVILALPFLVAHLLIFVSISRGGDTELATRREQEKQRGKDKENGVQDSVAD